MLTITETAVDAVRGIVSKSTEVSDETAGIRLFAAPDATGGTQLALSLENGPSDGDGVVEDAGARVFLDSEIIGFLADKQLDAETGETGTQFLLRDQEVP